MRRESGIAPNDLPHIFERFYRAEESCREHKGGSGLGLPIAKALVEAHRGRIWAESDGVPGRRESGEVRARLTQTVGRLPAQGLGVAYQQRFCNQ